MAAKSRSRHRSQKRAPWRHSTGRLALIAALLVAVVLVAGLLLNCAPPREALALPAAIDGWNRVSEEPLDPSSFPESLRRLEAVRGRRATYRGLQSSAIATVYEMPSATSAFEALQTYHRSAGEYYFQKGSDFVVLGLAELASDAQRPFLLEFQKAVSPDVSKHP